MSTVTGGSGGGPHALAVAARIPERVIQTACDVGVAPYEAEGLDWFDGMDPENPASPSESRRTHRRRQR